MSHSTAFSPSHARRGDDDPLSDRLPRSPPSAPAASYVHDYDLDSHDSPTVPSRPARFDDCLLPSGPPSPSLPPVPSTVSPRYVPRPRQGPVTCRPPLPNPAWLAARDCACGSLLLRSAPSRQTTNRRRGHSNSRLCDLDDRRDYHPAVGPDERRSTPAAFSSLLQRHNLCICFCLLASANR